MAGDAAAEVAEVLSAELLQPARTSPAARASAAIGSTFIDNLLLLRCELLEANPGSAIPRDGNCADSGLCAMALLSEPSLITVTSAPPLIAFVSCVVGPSSLSPK